MRNGNGKRMLPLSFEYLLQGNEGIDFKGTLKDSYRPEQHYYVSSTIVCYHIDSDASLTGIVYYRRKIERKSGDRIFLQKVIGKLKAICVVRKHESSCKGQYS